MTYLSPESNCIMLVSLPLHFMRRFAITLLFEVSVQVCVLLVTTTLPPVTLKLEIPVCRINIDKYLLNNLERTMHGMAIMVSGTKFEIAFQST